MTFSFDESPCQISTVIAFQSNCANTQTHTHTQRTNRTTQTTKVSVISLISFLIYTVSEKSATLFWETDKSSLNINPAQHFTWRTFTPPSKQRSLLVTGSLEVQDAKKSQFWHHRTNLSGYIFGIKAYVNNRKKVLNSNTSSTCPDNMANFGLLTAEICWRVWGTPANFSGFRVLAALLHGTLVVGV